MTRRGSARGADALAAESPLCNTGDGNTYEVGIHGLDFTSRKPVDEVLSVLDAFLGEFFQAEHGTKLYGRLWQARHGASVECEPRRGSVDHVRVSLPGEVCETFELADLVAMVELVEGRVTRVDAYVDGAPFSPEQIQQAWDNEQVVTKVHRGNAASNSYLRNCEGSSVYIGSPKADARLRVYDRRGPTRTELQTRRDKARAFWSSLLAGDDGEEFVRLVLGAIDGFVSFCEPAGKDTNRSRWGQRLGFWQAFVNGVAKVRLAVERVPSSIEALSRHVWRQAGPLVTYLEAQVKQGNCWQATIEGLIVQGRKRMTARQRAMLAGLDSAVGLALGA